MKSKILAASAAMTVMLCAVPGGIADAQTRPITGNDRSLSGSQISPDQRLSLEVHKKDFPPFDDPTPGSLPQGELSGITFVLHLAPEFDVTTDEGRKEASRARTQEEWDAIKRHEVARATTNDDRVATFTDLKPGLYLLEELRPDMDHDYLTSSPQWLVLPVADVSGKAFHHENLVVVKPAPCQTTTTSTSTTKTTTAPPPTPTPPPPPETESATQTRSPDIPDQDPPETNQSSPTGSLASTGANVLFVIIAGLTLIGLGLLISRRKAN